MQAALLLTLAAAAAFLLGWLWTGLALLVAVDAARPGRAAARGPAPAAAAGRDRGLGALLWPAAGDRLARARLVGMAATAAAGARLFAAMVTVAFAEAARIERGKTEIPGGIWLFSRRNAIFALLPFAALGAWTTGIVALSLYAAVSFFLVQYVAHRLRPS